MFANVNIHLNRNPFLQRTKKFPLLVYVKLSCCPGYEYVHMLRVPPKLLHIVSGVLMLLLSAALSTKISKAHHREVPQHFTVMWNSISEPDQLLGIASGESARSRNRHNLPSIISSRSACTARWLWKYRIAKSDIKPSANVERFLELLFPRTRPHCIHQRISHAHPILASLLRKQALVFLKPNV